MEVTGKVVQINDPVTGEGKNGPWKKQEVILEMDGQYPKKICLTCWGDKLPIDQLSEGETITAAIDVESREYNGRWYTDVKAWRIDRGGASLNEPGVDPPPPEGYDDLPTEEDDLPF